MGLNKSYVRTRAASQEYRDNWDRIFGEYKEPDEEKHVSCPRCRRPDLTEEGLPSHIQACMSWLDCPLEERCINNNYEVGSGERCPGCER